MKQNTYRCKFCACEWGLRPHSHAQNNTCKYFAIWSKYAHVSKGIFTLRSHAYSVHISILMVHALVVQQTYTDC